MASIPKRADRLMGMRANLAYAMADAVNGDRALEASYRVTTNEPALMSAEAARAQAYYQSSIARSLLLLADRIVDDEQTDMGMSNLPPVLPVKDDRRRSRG